MRGFSGLSIAFLMLVPSLPALAGDTMVTVSSNVFTPSQVTIDVGDTVTWTNQQGFHNVDSDTPGLFRSGAPANAPWTFAHTFDQVGTFLYHCDVHGAAGGFGMSGRVIVEESGGGGGGGGDDPGQVRLAPPNYNVDEGAGSISVRIERLLGDDGAASVVLATENGSATAGSDYVAVNQAVNWADGEDGFKSVNVILLEDTAVEGDENFALRLSNATGVALGTPAGGNVVITDNDQAPPLPEECQPGPDIACLLAGRFQVEVDWRKPNGETGRGVVVPIAGSDRSTLFYFFAADNIEMLFKMVDACPTAFDSFWVFYAATTNVEFTITVTDTVAGVVKEYVNPLGMAASPIQDTSAFATCP